MKTCDEQLAALSALNAQARGAAGRAVDPVTISRTHPQAAPNPGPA